MRHDDVARVDQRRSSVDTAGHELEVAIPGLMLVEAADSFKDVAPDEEIRRLGIAVAYLLLVVPRAVDVEERPQRRLYWRSEADTASDKISVTESRKPCLEPVSLRTAVGVAECEDTSACDSDRTVASSVGILWRA